MKKILVPTDFSPNALRAIDYAVKIARLNEATIYLIHALDIPDTSEAYMPPPKDAFNGNKRSDTLKQLEMLRRSIEDSEKILVNTHLYNGPVTDVVLDAVKEHSIDLIIMGTLGITGLADKIFGTHTASVIAHSTVPVLAIPVEFEWKAPSKIMLAINEFDNKLAGIIKPVFEIADIFKAEVRVTVFTDEDDAGAADYMDHARDVVFATEKLKLRHKSIQVRSEHLSGHRFIETVSNYIDENNIDMLGMITHKRSLVGGLFDRSLTKKMSYHSRVPLLAIPALK